MRGLIFLSFLILFSIFSQAYGNLSEKILSDRSGDVQIRKKRLIDTVSNRYIPTDIDKEPYVVNILKDGIPNSAGSILGPHIIITAAHSSWGFDISILSGSSNVNRGQPHSVTMTITHPHYNNRTFRNDLALLVISPRIDFEHSANKPISLFIGNLPPNSHGIISGWGRISRDREIYSEELRSIEVPIISIAECQRAYHNVAGLTSKDICTYYEGRQKCCHDGDSGSPLVVRGHLVGVMSWSGEDHNPHYPDVFVNLVDIENRNWVLSNLEHITRWH